MGEPIETPLDKKYLEDKKREELLKSLRKSPCRKLR